MIMGRGEGGELGRGRSGTVPFSLTAAEIFYFFLVFRSLLRCSHITMALLSFSIHRSPLYVSVNEKLVFANMFRVVLHAF